MSNDLPGSAARPTRRHGHLVTATLAAALSSAAAAQFPASDVALFVPGDHVPLSEFAQKGPSALTLHVHPEILMWVNDESSSVQVAVMPLGGGVTYQSAQSVDPIAGTVTYSGPPGRCVVVCPDLLHNTSIVTHWAACHETNEERGGQWIGATDGFLEWDYGYDPLGPAPHQLISSTNMSIKNDDMSWGNPPGNPSPAPYAYASNLLALFSDGSGQHDDDTVPDYEVYPAENFSMNAFTPSAAVYLSDWARASTGVPVAHRSHPTAFPGFGGPTPVPGQRVEDGIPIFQVVHCFEVTPLDDADPAGYQDGDHVGNEHSLASFILPPYWTSQDDDDTYTVLFNGFYDINENTFRVEGPRFIDALAERWSEGDKVVGILWNGGGGQTFHRSAYANAAKLFDDAATLLKTNKHTMVFSGGSRGGTTALEMASNPYDYDYRAKIANARAPQVRVGTAIRINLNPSHSENVQAMDGYTGYLDSWKVGWNEPGMPDNGKTLVLKNFFDTRFPEVVDTYHSIDSAFFVDALKMSGCKVVLRWGTNDAFGSSALVARYANHLGKASIPVLCEVYYRFGHAVPYTHPDEADLLAMAIDDDPSFPSETRYFATDPNDYDTPVAIAPPYVPLAFETCLGVGTQFQLDPLPLQYPQESTVATHTWTFFGEPYSRVQVWIGSFDLDPTDPESEGLNVFDAQLLPEDPADEFVHVVVEVPSPPVAEWRYYLKYDGDNDGTFETLLNGAAFAAPDHHLAAVTENPSFPQASFLVASGEFPGLSDATKTRTGGLAGDQEFVVP